MLGPSPARLRRAPSPKGRGINLSLWERSASEAVLANKVSGIVQMVAFSVAAGLELQTRNPCSKFAIGLRPTMIFVTSSCETPRAGSSPLSLPMERGRPPSRRFR
jgi:hypothetical protein